MADTQMFELGWETAAERAKERRERREALEDEERQLRVTDLYSKSRELAGHLSKLGDDDPLKKSGMDALTNVETQLSEIYHPIKAPGALQRDWHWLEGLITGRTKTTPVVLQKTTEAGTPEASLTMNGQQVTLPSTPAYTTVQPQPQRMTKQQRQLAAQRQEARTRAEQDVAAAADLSPEQQAAVDARAAGTKALETTRSARNVYRQTGLPPEGEENFVRQTLENAYGIKTPTGSQKWERVKAHVNGMPRDLLFYQGQYYYSDGTPLEPDEARGVVVDPKPTAGARGLKYDKTTGQVLDPATGQRYNAGDPNNPLDVRSMFAGADKMLADTRAFQTKLAGMRATSYNASKPLASYDSWNGNAPTEVPFSEYSKYPGRYLPAGPADKAIAKENLMQDISGTSQLTRDAINNLKEDFPFDMQTKIALAMRAEHPDQMLDQLMASGALGTLTPDQQDFLIATRQLAENAMAMRSILGAGQGSEDMRNAIRETLPTLLSPDKSFALRQLDAFDKTIARLHRGVPSVPLNERPFPAGGAAPQGGRAPGAAPRTGAAGAGAKGSRSISQVKQYFQSHPQQAQKTFGTTSPSEPQVVQYIEGRGYVATQP